MGNEFEIELIPKIVRPKFGEILPVNQARTGRQPYVLPKITVASTCNQNQPAAALLKALIASQEIP